MTDHGYNLSREVAARLIDRSIRTLDRYIKSGKIRFIKTDGRTWLSREDVLKYAKNDRKDIDNSSSLDMTRQEDISGSGRINAITEESNKGESLLIQSLNTKLAKQNLLLKKSLDTIQRLKEQLNNSLPIKEHEQKFQIIKNQQLKYIDYIKKMDLHYKSKTSKLNSEIDLISNKYHGERLNKNIIMVILSLILLLQPILFFVL